MAEITHYDDQGRPVVDFFEQQDFLARTAALYALCFYQHGPAAIMGIWPGVIMLWVYGGALTLFYVIAGPFYVVLWPLMKITQWLIDKFVPKPIQELCRWTIQCEEAIVHHKPMPSMPQGAIGVLDACISTLKRHDHRSDDLQTDV